jgi:acetyl esterase/lipase
MYMSPGPLIPDDLLQLFPKTHIICAGNDPLRDESYYFIDRLLSNGVDARITEMEMMPHGFLNYNMKFSKMNEALPAIMKSVEILKSLIN